MHANIWRWICIICCRRWLLRNENLITKLGLKFHNFLLLLFFFLLLFLAVVRSFAFLSCASARRGWCGLLTTAESICLLPTSDNVIIQFGSNAHTNKIGSPMLRRPIYHFHWGVDLRLQSRAAGCACRRIFRMRQPFSFIRNGFFFSFVFSVSELSILYYFFYIYTFFALLLLLFCLRSWCAVGLCVA